MALHSPVGSFRGAGGTTPELFQLMSERVWQLSIQAKTSPPPTVTPSWPSSGSVSPASRATRMGLRTEVTLPATAPRPTISPREDTVRLRAWLGRVAGPWSSVPRPSDAPPTVLTFD